MCFFSLFFLCFTDECVSFLTKQAKSLNLPVKVIEVQPKKPIVIITWKGTEPEKPSILLNGHNDVVPVVAVSHMPSYFLESYI